MDDEARNGQTTYKFSVAPVITSVTRIGKTIDRIRKNGYADSFSRRNGTPIRSANQNPSQVRSLRRQPFPAKRNPTSIRRSGGTTK